MSDPTIPIRLDEEHVKAIDKASKKFNLPKSQIYRITSKAGLKALERMSPDALISFISTKITNYEQETKANDLYNKKWMRYAIDKKTGALSPYNNGEPITFSQLVDSEYPECDPTFADVCEEHLINSQLGVPTLIQEDDQGEPCLLIRVK